ncbi:MAG: ABC transporter permease [Deltaproteobacteria bacterium]|nr:ABC transporter permease [Deltaproteobacteria bacterium]
MFRRKKIYHFWRVYSQRKTAVFGLVIVIFFFLVLILAPYLAPYDPDKRFKERFDPPSREHLLGTNDIGNDILSELIYAGRISLTIGLIAAAIIISVGVTIGVISGYFGGVVDEILMRITDVVLIMPRLPLMLALGAYLGPGIGTIIFVYCLVGWATVTRPIRAQILSIKEFSFVEASRAMGAGNLQIIASHIVPNILGIVLAYAVMEIMYAILTEAGLSFLGLGDPTHKSWGVMLHFAQAQGAFMQGAWWWIVPPGVCIALINCGFNFIGTALNDLFSLKLGKR